MPELPEVETIRRHLLNDVKGKTIKHIEVRVGKMFVGDPDKLAGKKILDILRGGKVFNFKFADDLFLNVHLKMTGQLLFSRTPAAEYKVAIPHVKSRSLPAKTTHIMIDFTDGSRLFFNDLRKFGWMKISSKPETPKGTDVLSPNFNLSLFTDLTNSTAKPIKLMLMDQDRISGVGNIYANDALFEAGLSPLRPAKSLSEKENEKLYDAVKFVINEGIKYNGSSDESYILPDATTGRYQEHFRVYAQEGKPCPKKCGGKIIRIKQGGRSTFYCPKCQV